MQILNIGMIKRFKKNTNRSWQSGTITRIICYLGKLKLGTSKTKWNYQEESVIVYLLFTHQYPLIQEIPNLKITFPFSSSGIGILNLLSTVIKVLSVFPRYLVLLLTSSFSGSEE